MSTPTPTPTPHDRAFQNLLAVLATVWRTAPRPKDVHPHDKLEVTMFCIDSFNLQKYGGDGAVEAIRYAFELEQDYGYHCMIQIVSKEFTP